MPTTTYHDWDDPTYPRRTQYERLCAYLSELRQQLNSAQSLGNEGASRSAFDRSAEIARLEETKTKYENELGIGGVAFDQGQVDFRG